MTTPKEFMAKAIAMSKKSIQSGSSPFGAVIVKDNKVIAKAYNTVVPDNDPTAHAEVNCIRQAAQKLGTFDLTGCVLYTSCEPCPMCLNAIKWANITKVYYAATRQDADDIGFRDKVFYESDPIKLIHLKSDTAQEIMHLWSNKKNKKEY